MSVLQGPPSRGKTTAFKGNFYVRQWRGRLVVCKWPRKRKPNLDAGTRQRNDDFKQANWLVKYMDPRQIMTARNAAAGTPLMPRDIHIANTYGRLYAFAREGGGFAYSKAMVSDVSFNLDIIGQQAGDLLARGPDSWEPVHATTAGFVLTSNGPNAKPSFQATGGSGGSRAMTVLPVNPKSNSTFATKGWFFTPLTDTQVTAGVPSYDEVTSGTYIVTLAEMNGATLGPVLNQSPVHVGTGGLAVRALFEFATPTSLTAGTEYAIMLTRTDVANNHALPLRLSNTTLPPAPIATTIGYMRMTTTSPAEGQTTNRSETPNIFAVNFLYSL